MAKKKNKLAFPVGIVAIILAVVGLVTTVRFGIDFVNDKKDQTALKQEYEEFLKSVVMFDPDPFDDLTQADYAQLMYASVWALLMDEDGVDKYSYSTGETVGIVVPQEDIEKYFVYLFGNEIDVTSLHTSVDMSSYDITYDSALKSYILPITGVDSAYIPRVTNITKQGSSQVLTVEYIGSKAFADVNESEYVSPSADKTMTITLRQGNDGMYVSSIQTTNRTEYVTEEITEYDEDYIEEEAEEETEDLTEETDISETEAVSYEVVTDENGEAVTDENGETQTVAVTEETTQDESESASDYDVTSEENLSEGTNEY